MLRKLFLSALLSSLLGTPLLVHAKSDPGEAKKANEIVAQALQAESAGDLSLQRGHWPRIKTSSRPTWNASA